MLNGKGVEKRTNVTMVRVLPLNCVKEISFLKSFSYAGLVKKRKKKRKLQTSLFVSFVSLDQDSGPQLPTDVTPMLKYGTNLIQVIGKFIGMNTTM